MTYPVVPALRLGGLRRSSRSALYVVVNRTRLGMMIRAGASNRDMVRGLGIDIRLLYRIVFAGRRGAGRARRHDRGAAVVGLSGHGRERADHLLRRRRDRRHRLDHRRARSPRCWSASSTPSARSSSPSWSGVGIYVLMAVILRLAARRADEAWRLRPLPTTQRRRCRRLPDIARASSAAGACRSPLRWSRCCRVDLAVRQDLSSIRLRDLRAEPRAAGRRDRPREPRPRGLLGIGAYATVLASGDERRARSRWLLPLAIGSAPRPTRSSSAR